jgi:hypothetical protein
MKLRARPIARGRRVLGWLATLKIRGVRFAACWHRHETPEQAEACRKANKKLLKLQGS